MEYFEQCFEWGVKQDEFDMAIKFKQVLGIGELCRISGFSKEDLENEILSKSD